MLIFNEVNYETIKNNLHNDSKKLLFNAMDLFSAIKIVTSNRRYSNRRLATLSLFFEMLRSTEMSKETNEKRLTYKYFADKFAIDCLNIVPLTNEEYTKIYNNYFKTIIYNIFLVAHCQFMCDTLKDLSPDYMIGLYFDRGITENKVITDIITDIDPDMMLEIEAITNNHITKATDWDFSNPRVDLFCQNSPEFQQYNALSSKITTDIMKVLDKPEQPKEPAKVYQFPKQTP